MTSIRETFDRVLSNARRRPLAVAATTLAAIIVGGLLGAVLAEGAGSSDLADAAASPSTPSSPGSPISTAGFGGDLVSPTLSPGPSGSATSSATGSATPSASPIAVLTPMPAAPGPDDGFGGITPSPTAVPVRWQEIPEMPVPVGELTVRHAFELATGEIAISGNVDNDAGHSVGFLRVYEPQARVWREVAIVGLDETRAIRPAAVGSDGQIFLLTRDVSGVDWLSITPVDTASEPWVAGIEHVIVENGFPDPGDLKTAQIGDRLYIPEVLVGDGDTRFLVYDLATGEITRTAPTTGARFLDVTTDGTYLYAGDDDGAARYDPRADSWDAVVPEPDFGDPAYQFAVATSVERLWVPVRNETGTQKLWTWDGSTQTWSLVETPNGADLDMVRLVGTHDGELYMVTPSGIFQAEDLPE